MFTHTHTRICRIFSKLFTIPLHFYLRLFLVSLFKKRLSAASLPGMKLYQTTAQEFTSYWGQRVSDHAKHRKNGLLTQLKNKTNEINQTRNFSVCRLLNFLFKHFLKNKKSRNVQQDSMNSFLELAIKQPRAGRALNRYKFLLFFNCTLFSQTVWWREIIVCVVKGKERRKNKNPFLVLTTPIQFSRTWRERSGPF